MKTLSKVLAYLVSADMADEELLDMMRSMKVVREAKEPAHIVCTVDGFNEDPRELADIPEARALCHRLVGLGFISYVELSTCIEAPQCDPILSAALGAFEIWLIARGVLRPGVRLDWSIYDQFIEELKQANGRADAAVGKLRRSAAKGGDQ